MPTLKYFDPGTQTWTVIPACGDGSGGSGDLHYAFVQSMPSLSWVVVHNLGKNPSVTVIDSGGGIVIGDISYDSLNQCTLTFAGEFSGTAYLN